jgi:hypothetical protein
VRSARSSWRTLRLATIWGCNNITMYSTSAHGTFYPRAGSSSVTQSRGLLWYDYKRPYILANVTGRPSHLVEDDGPYIDPHAASLLRLTSEPVVGSSLPATAGRRLPQARGPAFARHYSDVITRVIECRGYPQETP